MELQNVAIFQMISKIYGLEVAAVHCGRKSPNLPPTGSLFWCDRLLLGVLPVTLKKTFALCLLFLLWERFFLVLGTLQGFLGTRPKEVIPLTRQSTQFKFGRCIPHPSL